MHAFGDSFLSCFYFPRNCPTYIHRDMSSLPRSWHQISLQHNILDSNSRNPFSSLPWLAQATSTSESISKSWIQEGYPTHLSTASRSGAIELQREGRLAVYRGAGSSDQDIAVARANLRFPPSCGIAYFEVLVVSSGRDGCVTVQYGISFLFSSCRLDVFLPTIALMFSYFLRSFFCSL